MKTSSPTGRTARNSVFALSGVVGQNLMRLGSNLIMTRLVAPEAFGLIAIAAVLNFWVAMFTDIGVTQSVIRSRRGTEPEYLATAYALQIARNFVIALLIAIAAFALHFLQVEGVLTGDGVFSSPLLPWFIAATALGMAITGFNSLKVALSYREQRVGRVVRMQLAIQAASIVTMIVAAHLGAGPFALVAGQLAGGLYLALASNLFLPGPRIVPKFHREFFTEIFDFGKWLMLASGFYGIASKADQMIFGALMPLEAFSLLSIAGIWTQAGRQLITTIISRVTMPIFAERLRSEPDGLARTYRKVRLAIDALALSMFFGVVLFADMLISLLYPDKFGETAHYLRLLALALLFVPYSLLSEVVLAGGKSKRHMAMMFIWAMTTVFGTLAAYRLFGLTAAIVTASVAQATTLPYIWRAAAAHMKLSPFVEGRMLAVAAIAAPVLAMTA